VQDLRVEEAARQGRLEQEGQEGRGRLNDAEIERKTATKVNDNKKDRTKSEARSSF
jgi:hypothetical protein